MVVLGPPNGVGARSSRRKRVTTSRSPAPPWIAAAANASAAATAN